LFKNLSLALIEHEIIKTTVPKAKELKKYLEPLITVSKNDSVANRRRVFDKLRCKKSVGKLFKEIGPKSSSRAGGYLRIIKAGFRPGDKADMAFVEWVDRSTTEDAETEVPELKESEVS
jgi:large subunit ribosomal protein L17